MRAFRIALVIFTLLIGLITVSTVYGLRVCRKMEAMVEKLSDEPSESNAVLADELRAYWQKQTPYLRPLVNRTVIRTMSDLLIELTLYADDGESAADYRATCDKVLGAIDEMRRAEKATFGLWS